MKPSRVVNPKPVEPPMRQETEELEEPRKRLRVKTSMTGGTVADQCESIGYGGAPVHQSEEQERRTQKREAPEPVEDLEEKSQEATTEQLIELARLRQEGGGQVQVARAKVCGTCLGEHSDHTNEIVECDGCGVSVHEACYGIQVIG